MMRKIREKANGCGGSGGGCCGEIQEDCGCRGGCGQENEGRGEGCGGGGCGDCGCGDEGFGDEGFGGGCGGCGCGGEQAEGFAEAAENTANDAADDSPEGAGADGAAKAADPEEEALNVKYMRLMADFQNYKRRTEKEKADTYAYANEKLVGELLNVIDNFERALAVGGCEDGFAQGMNMIFTQLLGVLEKAGVKEIESLGADFDPNFHNAVMMEEGSEYESGKVSEVLQKGYTLNGKVVRPAMVKVAS